MRSTRAEVAKLAGVSPSVVSYVLNGGPRNVAPETRRRVEEAIASLEYRPNAIAQALRGGRSGAIGVVVGSGQELLFRAVSFALQKAAQSFGYAMYVSFASDAATERQYARSLVDRQVDALIAIQLEDPTMLHELREDGLPLAFVGEREIPSWMLSLHTDPAEANRELLAAVAARRPPVVAYSDRLLPRLSHADIVAAVAADIPVLGLDTETAEGGAGLLRTLQTHPGAVVMCATDRELRRLLWLAGSTGLDPRQHTFTNSRVDFRDDGGVDGDISVSWDLDRPFKEIFGGLIRMIDSADAASGTVDLHWQVVSNAEAPELAPRIWGVTDM